MTVCNMSIEAGARAGMIAPDEVTFEYLEGRRHAPERRRLGPGGRGLACAGDRRRAPGSTPRSTSTPPIRPQVSWGTNPAQVVAIDGEVPSPDDLATPGRAGGRRPRARLHGPRGRHADALDRGGHGVHRLVHELEDRGPADRGRGARGRAGPTWPACARRAGLAPGQAPGRGGGTGPGLRRSGLRVARERLLDVPRHEPRSAVARGTLRLHLEPQFRGPPGTGRPHPSRVAGGRRGYLGGGPVRHPGRPRGPEDGARDGS